MKFVPLQPKYMSDSPCSQYHKADPPVSYKRVIYVSTEANIAANKKAMGILRPILGLKTNN